MGLNFELKISTEFVWNVGIFHCPLIHELVLFPLICPLYTSEHTVDIPLLSKFLWFTFQEKVSGWSLCECAHASDHRPKLRRRRAVLHYTTYYLMIASERGSEVCSFFIPSFPCRE